MKIIHVTPGLLRIPPQRGGGVERAILLWSRHIAEIGHDVVILDRRYGSDKPVEYVQDVLLIRIKAPRFKIPGRVGKSKLQPIAVRIEDYVNELIFVFLATRYLRQIPDAIVHVHSILGGLLLLILRRGKEQNLIYTSHQPLYTKDSLGLGRMLTFGVESFIMNRVGHVIALNALQRQIAIASGNIRPERVAIARVPIDMSELQEPISIREALEMFPLDGKQVILCVARVSPEKGTEYLVKAADRIVNQLCHTNVLFVFVGPQTGFGPSQKVKNSYANRIQGLVNEYHLLKNVIFTGSLTQEVLNQFFTLSEIFALPSLNEGEPGVVVQAMAFGKPIVASRVGGIPLQVKNGWNGFLVNPGDSGMLADRIAYMLDNQEVTLQMGKNSRILAAAEFDYKAIGRNLLEAYKRWFKDDWS